MITHYGKPSEMKVESLLIELTRVLSFAMHHIFFYLQQEKLPLFYFPHCDSVYVSNIGKQSQRRIQNPVERLRWIFLRKQLTAFNLLTIFAKSSIWMFDQVLNTFPLSTSIHSPLVFRSFSAVSPFFTPNCQSALKSLQSRQGTEIWICK